MSPAAQPEKVRALNDAFRTAGPDGHWIITSGVQAFGGLKVALIVNLVRIYDRFTPDNDPYGEHDFGSLDLGAAKLFWKIDYYDRSMEGGSENPANPEVTTRVMTIMRADEY